MNYSLFPEIKPFAKDQFEESENNPIIHLRTSRALLKRLGWKRFEGRLRG
jgi:hypothetical protein